MNVVKIKREKYGDALALLIKGGGGFQTRHEATVLVTSVQRRAIEDAGLVAEEPKQKKPGTGRGKKTK